MKRKLVAWARRRPMLRRLAYSRVGGLLRRAVGPVTPSPAELDEYSAWRETRLRERRHVYRVVPRPGLLSLLTPVWNTAVRYLDVLAKSVLTQRDYPCFEWVVLDNGSTDAETRGYLRNLATHGAVKFFRVEENLGIIGGMRYCLERATGRYILPVDSDDYLYPDCLQVMAWHIEHHGFPPLLYSDEDMLQGEQSHMPYLKPDWDPVLFLNSCYIAHLCAIDRCSALELGAYSDRDADGCHDWDTFLRFMLVGHVPVHVPEVIYSWRVHPGSANMNIGSKPYVYASHEHVLGRFLATRRDPERYAVHLSPLFNGSPDWWFRRAHTDSRPLLSLVLSSDPASVDTGALIGSAEYPDHRVRAVALDSGLDEVRRLAGEAADRGGLVHLIFERVRMQGREWPWEVLALTELYPDVVMVGGRVYNGAHLVVAGGEYLGVGGDCGCPDVNRSLADPGYFAQMWKQRSVSAVSSMLAIVDAGFLVELLDRREYADMSLPFLGAWAGALALRTGKRIVYSPHVTGYGELDRKEWEALISHAERSAFVRANRDILPDTRFLSRLLSLDPARPYAPVSAAAREDFLRRSWSGGHEPSTSFGTGETATDTFSFKGYEIPVRLIDLTGGGPDTFAAISAGHMDQLRRYTPIQPSHHVVEIGCGIGRDAIPLTEILSAEGSYTGVDIVYDSIEWCRQHLSRRHPNFRFLHYDVKDQLHNPRGTMSTRQIRLPFGEGAVDRMIVQSVFTHMFEADIIHYLQEFRRILKDDGMVLASFFMVDTEVLRRAREVDLTPFHLRFEYYLGDGCYVNDPRFPAGAVAYTLAALGRMLEKSGLGLIQPVHRGSWSGLYTDTSDGQDMVVLGRAGDARARNHISG